MAYVTLSTLHNPTTGTSPPATFGDQIGDNDEYLYQRGPYICTAATRPGSPFKGQVIYETDTGKVLIYYGATTTWQPPWNLPWGRLGSASVTANQSGITSAVDLTSLTLTWTAVANRYYRVSWAGEVSTTNADGVFVVALTDTAPSQAKRSTAALTSTSSMSFGDFHVLTSGAGAITRKLRMSKIGGTGSVALVAASDNPAWILVEDIGGGTVPAA